MQKRMDWDEYQPIQILPGNIQGYFVDDAAFLREDLLENKLKIILRPAPEERHCGHMIRMVETLNPEWYSKLYSEISHFRRDRSLRALERIASRRDEAFTDTNCGTVEYKYNYDSIYRKLIFGRLTEGFEFQGTEVRPNREVCTYFGVNEEFEEIPF